MIKDEAPKIIKHPGTNTTKYYEIARKYCAQENLFAAYEYPLFIQKPTDVKLKTSMVTFFWILQWVTPP